MATTAIKRASGLFRRHNGVLRTNAALALGIHPRVLYEMRDNGVIEPVARGLYRLASTELADPDLVAVALRVPRAVVCLISALALHRLTTEIPHEIWIALPKGTKTPRLEHPPLRVVRLSPAIFDDGIEHRSISGTNVRVYNPAKTVAECFRFRNKIGIDVAVGALRSAIQDKRARIDDILKHAKLGRVDRVMRPYLEALL